MVPPEHEGLESLHPVGRTHPLTGDRIARLEDEIGNDLADLRHIGLARLDIADDFAGFDAAHAIDFTPYCSELIAPLVQASVVAGSVSQMLQKAP